jgi:16S rRNA G1207 methylase RsmC
MFNKLDKWERFMMFVILFVLFMMIILPFVISSSGVVPTKIVSDSKSGVIKTEKQKEEARRKVREKVVPMTTIFIFGPDGTVKYSYNARVEVFAKDNMIYFDYHGKRYVFYNCAVEVIIDNRELDYED